MVVSHGKWDARGRRLLASRQELADHRQIMMV